MTFILLVAFLLIAHLGNAFIFSPTQSFSLSRLNLFGKGKKASASSSGSAEATAAIAIFRKDEPTSELQDAKLLKSFNEITTMLKGDKAVALKIFTNSPDLFKYVSREAKTKVSIGGPNIATTESINLCFNIFVEKFGFEKAVGLVTRWTNSPYLSTHQYIYFLSPSISPLSYPLLLLLSLLSLLFSLLALHTCFSLVLVISFTFSFSFSFSFNYFFSNPNLLCVRPTGYGGADQTGDDAIAISYLIDATRGKGQFYLGFLALLLLSKPLGISFSDLLP